MTVRELLYLRELVRRDGDAELQLAFGVLSKKALADKLTCITHDAAGGRATYFAVFPDTSIEVGHIE